MERKITLKKCCLTCANHDVQEPFCYPNKNCNECSDLFGKPCQDYKDFSIDVMETFTKTIGVETYTLSVADTLRVIMILKNLQRVIDVEEPLQVLIDHLEVENKKDIKRT